MKKQDITNTKGSGVSDVVPPPTPDRDVEFYEGLVYRAVRGDAEAVGLLKERGLSVDAEVGPHFNLAIHLQEKMLFEAGGDDRELREGLRKGAARLRAELMGTNPPRIPLPKARTRHVHSSESR